MTSRILQPGSRLGSYEVQEELGRGALGVVYRAMHRYLRRPVALKVLHPHWTGSPEFVERFRTEGRVMAMLEHPNILRVHDAGEEDGVFFLAMSYLDGRTLEKLVGAPVPLEAALKVIGQLLRGLAYAHSHGVIHRDVKPANVMVGQQGQVTLMDLGVARLLDQPGLTVPGVRVGTPYYMAPEQVQGLEVDGRADLYSTGIVLYEMLSGRVPFPGPATDLVYSAHLRQEPPLDDLACPAWLIAVLRRALAKTPAERFRSAEELLFALNARQEPPRADAAGAAPDPEWLKPAPKPPDPGSAAVRREELSALSLDVVQSAKMKLPGLTMAIQQQFGLFRRYVGEHLTEQHCIQHLWAGDGLLALFMRPAQAAACAEAILRGLPEFNAGVAAKREPIRVRIGVHRGPVQMTPGQPLGEVISRTLDYAGHLQKTASADEALISEAVYFGVTENRHWTAAGAVYALAFPFPIYRFAAAPAVATPSPAPAQSHSIAARFRLVSGPQEAEFVVPAEALIGRSDATSSRPPDIEIKHDSAVSRRHARIFVRGESCLIEDLESANGTDLNGRPLPPREPAEVRPGDEVTLGERTVLRLIALEGKAP